MDTVKMNYFYASQARDLNWKVFPTGHSMRVSMVIECIKNGVPEEHIINLCRWQNDHMLQLHKKITTLSIQGTVQAIKPPPPTNFLMLCPKEPGKERFLSLPRSPSKRNLKFGSLAH